MQEVALWQGQSQIGSVLVDATSQWTVSFESGKGVATPGPRPRLSVSCPDNAEQWRERSARTWFEHLLPDQEARRPLYRRQGLTTGNDVALLAAQGADCVGAIRFLAPGRRPSRAIQRARTFSHQQLRALLDGLRNGEAPPEEIALAYLLPGSRPKIPVQRQGESYGLPTTNIEAETTHLWKVDTKELPAQSLNEWFCMRLAESARLRVASVALDDAFDGALLVERIDRNRDAAGRISRIHMEDFCQIRGVEPGQLFEREGGMSLLECAAVIRAHSAVPILDIRAFLHWILFSCLVGFGAGHSKHLALLHTAEGARLGPFYGIWSSHIYPEMSSRIAMSIGREDRPDWLIAARWRELARELQIRPRYVLDALRGFARTLPQLAEGILATAPPAVRQSEIVNALVALLTRRCRQALVSVVAESQ